jgi:hypothetical protein
MCGHENRRSSEDENGFGGAVQKQPASNDGSQAGSDADPREHRTIPPERGANGAEADEKRDTDDASLG